MVRIRHRLDVYPPDVHGRPREGEEGCADAEARREQGGRGSGYVAGRAVEPLRSDGALRQGAQTRLRAGTGEAEGSRRAREVSVDARRTRLVPQGRGRPERA